MQFVPDTFATSSALIKVMTTVLHIIYIIIYYTVVYSVVYTSHGLRLLLGTEAPVMTPNGVDFLFFLYHTVRSGQVVYVYRPCSNQCSLDLDLSTVIISIEFARTVQSASEEDILHASARQLL